MASKRRLRRKACTGKVRFASQDDALAAIKAMIRKHGRGIGVMTPYRCPFCNGFHFGHPPRRVRQALGLYA